MANEQSFAKALFFGVVAEDLIFPYPQLPPDEKQATHTLVDRVKKLLESETDPAAIDREGRLEPRLLDRLRELELFGLWIPTAYGGGRFFGGAVVRGVGGEASQKTPIRFMFVAPRAAPGRPPLAFLARPAP